MMEPSVIKSCPLHYADSKGEQSFKAVFRLNRLIYNPVLTCALQGVSALLESKQTILPPV